MVRTVFPATWAPTSLLGDWDRAFARVFGADPFREVFGALGAPSEREGFLALDAWETPQAVHVEVDLPGVLVDQIDVQVQDDELVLKVERQDAPREGDQWLRRERGVGAFSRTFALPVRVDAGAVQAQLEHGVLHVTLPKAKEVQPRSIEVRTVQS